FIRISPTTAGFCGGGDGLRRCRRRGPLQANPLSSRLAPTAGTLARRRRPVPMLLLLTLTTFLAAFLLFLVQPMVAKMALPALGGSPAVWNTAMVVFQSLLLAGYAWAHWLARWPAGWRRWAVIAQCGLALLALLALPVGLPGWQPP